MQRPARVAVVLCLVLGSCSSGSSSPSKSSSATSTSSHSSQVSRKDGAIFSKIFAQFKAWRNALKSWSDAYKSPSGGNSFLTVEGEYTAKMHQASERINHFVHGVHDARLRSLLGELASGYQTEFNAIVDVNNSVINRDMKAGQRGLMTLREAALHKNNVAKQLFAVYPGLIQWERKAR